MSLLTSAEALARRGVAAGSGGALAPLASSLRRDLQTLLDRGFEIPLEKALLSRDGGRCPRDGAPLEFDPYQPHDHRCPICGEIFGGERHYLAWVMWYQLWLAERSVHAATLHALTGEAALAELATSILSGYSEIYLRYPNRDNVLGPGRPFFSTYLESIWLLQLCVALDLLETAGAAGTVGSVVREKLIAPSVSLIASFDEGASNRQVWNDAAVLAAGLLLGDRRAVQGAVEGRSGVLSHISEGLLVDGSWYEGENYHFFAHRGLWYGVTMAEGAGVEIPPVLLDRFQEAFAAPLATALPDFTFPSRRDSQYGVSLRQWRFAESCELGLARTDDPRLSGALHSLYAPGAAPRGDTGRWRSTAEAERNEPAAALSRADLGWRSLLLARESLSPGKPEPPRSALLEGQGIAVLRRDSGNAYMALDYGHSGGGHGHPDRLNLLLMRGDDRWLDDMGTGSYVDPTLHWYRSTLAHNAPLINGRSQQRVSGVLRAFEESGAAGWVDTELPWGSVAPGVRVRRSLVAMKSYAVDRIEWESAGSIRFELPLHIEASLETRGAWLAARLDDSSEPEDGFCFAHDAVFTHVDAGEMLRLVRHQRSAAWVVADSPSEWWRARAPGAPGKGEREFLLLRMRGTHGTAFLIWNWGAAIELASVIDGGVSVHMAGGARHDHRPVGNEWRVEMTSGEKCQALRLAGVRDVVARDAREPGRPSGSAATSLEAAFDAVSSTEPIPLGDSSPVTFELGRGSYRISEESWEEAGRPTATVRLLARGGELLVDVDVRKSPVVFRDADAEDPRLDNENPDIHSDGVQIHLHVPDGGGLVSWLAIPEPRGALRTHAIGGARSDVRLAARWHPTSTGYVVSVAIPLASLGVTEGGTFGLQVVVNDMAPGRARRRGQLVLRGGEGKHIYLRGDREQFVNFLRFAVHNA